MNRFPTSTDSNPPSEPLFLSAQTEEGQEFDPREQFEVFWRRRWTMLVIIVLVTLLGLVYALTRRPVYTAVNKLALATTSSKTASSSDISQLLPGFGLLGDTQNVATQVEIMKSPDLLDKAYAKLTRKEQMVGFNSPTTPLMSGAFAIDSTTDSDVVTITVKAFNAKIAAQMANNIAQTYLDENLKQTNESTSQARVYVENELKKQQADVKESNLELAKYKQLHHLEVPDIMVSNTASQVATLQVAVETSSSDLQGDQKRLETIDRQLSTMPGDLPFSRTVAENPEFALLRQKTADLQGQLITAQQEFTPASPEVTALRNELQTAQANLAKVIKNIVSSTSTQRNPTVDQLHLAYATAAAQEPVDRVKLAAAQTALAKRQAEMLKYPEEQRNLTELQLRVDVAVANFKALDIQYQTLQIQEKSNLPYGQIAAKARPPLIPSYPVKSQMVIGSFLLAVLLAAMMAKLLERFDTRVHDPMTVDRLTGRPILSVVPEVEPDKLATRSEILIGMVDANHAFLESFRLLRNNIVFSSPDQQMRVIAVTSAGKGEGKSTTSVNLAISIAMDGKRVLLIDGDLRRPAVHTFFKVPRTVGFSTVVKGLTPLDDAILSTEFENVSCLPAGPLPPNPTEFLNSEQARLVITEAKEKYDVVIIDSPPCTGLSDVQVISTLVDGVLLVVALEVTEKQYLIATMRLLRQAVAPVIGTVINRVEQRKRSYGYYSYYYGYYGYYYNYYSQYEEETPTKKRKKKRQKRSNSRGRDKVA